ncbi:hypothetical protein C9754_10180 [Listeria monocytogenes]|nr:hypothetical protein C9754_10180 [Listeria monocytogenes]
MIKLCTISDSQALLEVSYKTFDETFRAQNKPENMDAYLKTNFTAKKLSDELKNPHSYFYFVFHQEAIAGYLKLNIGDDEMSFAVPYLVFNGEGQDALTFYADVFY